MSERRPFSVDPETIAALLDGRLRGEERARVLAAIDASPELLAIVGDSAEARELAAPSAPPLAFRRTPRWLFATLAAAAVVVVVSIPLLTRRARAPEFSTPGVVAVLTRPAATSAELPTDAWSAVRGASDGASDNGRIVRVGALLANAHLLNAAGDTALRGVAAQIAALLENIPAAGINAPTFRHLATITPGAAASDSLREGTSGVESVLPADGLSTGAWLEAARVASARGDTAFFNAPMSNTGRSALVATAQGTNRLLADSLVAAVAAHPRDMSSINDLSTRLLGTLAR